MQFFIFTIFQFGFNSVLTITFTIYLYYSKDLVLNRHLQFDVFYKNTLTPNIRSELTFSLKMKEKQNEEIVNDFHISFLFELCFILSFSTTFSLSLAIICRLS